jgi:MOSC domain-containing protein YiiM
MRAELISVNVGLPRVVMSNGDPVSTGIFKEPVAGRVMLRTLNLDGDCQADLSVHADWPLKKLMITKCNGIAQCKLTVC